MEFNININNSFSLRKGNFITKITFDNCERSWIQPVQYEDHSAFGKRIVLASSRAVLFKLEDNPDVIEVMNNKLFYISKSYIEDGKIKDVDVLYEVDKDTNNVFRVSHLYIEYDNSEKILLHNESMETYFNIFNTIRQQFKHMVVGLMMKVNGVYIPFDEFNF